MKILVVEDTLIAQMVIKSMLTDEGCEVPSSRICIW